MDLKHDGGLLFLLTSCLISGFHANVIERNETRATFVENTRYCGCPPLSEFDKEGNHKWEIEITEHNIDLCGAKYSCREGYQTPDKNLCTTRFCFIQNDWNHTEPDCRKIDQHTEYPTVLFIVVPSALLAMVFIVMILFVRWWQRRSIHKSGENKLGDIEEEATVNKSRIEAQTSERELRGQPYVIEDDRSVTNTVVKL
ncbi:uncharacterized protein LOC128556376 [Mercenaria mercenaria]|uniref:uncharacterized protein LOC128556376 n=1 Tax=Mercenaria mercenaria TaxID=6596 RepID=UPI00234F457C|nr:uncharacterized protein LOC128556376 [Mercenaria mercenaria]